MRQVVKVRDAFGVESDMEVPAFSEADERLLVTLATSMGVALENARLFDETKRLLTEALDWLQSQPATDRRACVE